jgi:acetyl-CoA C-acetyltransferase
MNTAPEIVVCGPVRTPIGRFGGSLSHLSAAELGAVAAEAALERSGVSAGDVGEVIFGNARQAGGGPNVARQIAHRAGIPASVPAFTVNKACGSGLKCIVLAAQAIRCGDARIVLAGGAESMSGLPHFATGIRFGLKEGDIPLVDGMYKDGFSCPLCGQLMGATAETVAERYGVTRAEQDAYAAMSQNRAESAVRAGLFAAEIVPVALPPGPDGAPIRLDSDEHPRSGVTPDSLGKLPPVFKEGGSVHAGNSSGITDGAAAMIVTDMETARDLGIQPLFRLAGYASAGLEADIMGMGPVPALEKLQAKSGLDPANADLVEMNEAFAAQVLACQREIGLNLDRLNVNGGAIALGHPIGATGARIVVSLLHEMERRKCSTGIATLCISGGMGMAAQFERVRN